MDFKISDLTGLSAPITRLIEVVSAGVGKVTAPYLNAREIQVVAQAMKSVTNNADLDISYEEGKIAIKTLEAQRFITEPTTIESRASERILFETTKQQQYLERVTSHAALELSGERSVPEKKPDEDWIARFFDYAKNISSDQMQEIWGKILAGEIKRPGAFSLRTLDMVRNFSQQDCELFVRVAQYAFYTPSDVFIPNDIGAFTDNKLGYRQLLALEEMGLLQQSSAGIDPFKGGRTNFLFAFSDDVGVLVTNNPEHRPAKVRLRPGLQVWVFTKPARQLAQFFSRESPPGYVELFCEEIKELGWLPTIETYTNPEMPEFHEVPNQPARGRVVFDPYAARLICKKRRNPVQFRV